MLYTHAHTHTHTHTHTHFSHRFHTCRYDGDRDHDSFVAYINENARNPASVLTKGGKGGSKKRRGGKKGKKKGRKGKDEL